MMIGKLPILVAMLIALGTVGMSANSATAAGGQVPFHASFSGAAVADFVEGTVTFRGTGIATHLGLSANEGHVVITGPDNSCPGGFANTNDETVTATNGDSLTLTALDVACPVSEGVFHGTGHWVVTGGTGRFSGATGEVTFDGYTDFTQGATQGVFTFHLTGTISAPNGG